ncbi:MAG: putative phosphoserine phosphatase 2 [Candidatus Accumulibacter appositus]|uniref:Putative phosphoserine phosphatase 2 n=1 Tax=Candidatus Accumulibacter appositus TaxID=1454003 RepID=A0A011PKK6_9PROT|nr:alpha-ribazole phosphatase family protein [Accumulibacter sp.]EXI77562.1 MAG: putative phosphoserine phosphatase 2 [Candidatus Accumulibacter appositus]HRF05402.1 alpha-ribazole phosphatase family protein [Accumulibacter sp.]
MQLFLIRHPRPLLESGICYGRLDIEAEDPQPVAKRLRTFLPADTPIVTSPLRRALGLAEALHAQAQVDARLMEIDFGEWEGQRWSEIDRRFLDAWAADVLHFAPPGGESAAMLRARVIDCVDSLSLCAEYAKRLALVTHAGVIRAALGYWLQLPIKEWSQLPLAFGSISLLEIDRHGGLPQTESGQAAAQLRYLNH